MKKTFGFTLTELLIVVILVGVIAAFALPNYSKSLNSAHRRDAEIQLASIHSANSIYHAQSGAYLPTGTGDLSEINSGLNLGIIANGVIYTYARGASVNEYTAKAQYASGQCIEVTESGTVAISGTCP